MRLWPNLDRRERAFFYACAYLALLFVSTVSMWWIMLVGGDPFTIQNIGVVNKQGAPYEKFRGGDVVGIKRRICADSETAVEFFPALKDSHGFLYPLPNGLVKLPAGCTETVYGFVVPPGLPFGEYTYVSSVRYQKNLVGRDEHTALPQLRFRIMRKRPSTATSEPASEVDE